MDTADLRANIFDMEAVRLDTGPVSPVVSCAALEAIATKVVGG